jgi:hypothetical protein
MENGNNSFDAQKFTAWIRAKIRAERIHNPKMSLSHWASDHGFISQTVSNWVHGHVVRRPDAENSNRLIEMYGAEAVEILGVQRPDSFDGVPPEFKQAVVDAWASAAALMAAKGIDFH